MMRMRMRMNKMMIKDDKKMMRMRMNKMMRVRVIVIMVIKFISGLVRLVSITPGHVKLD